MEYLWLFAGLVAVVFGGDLFVRAAVGIAEHLKLPKVVIGGTFMALATTSPEVVVAVTSALMDAPGLAFGNAAGSVICNIALILGTMALIRPFHVVRAEVRVPMIVQGSLCIVVLVMAALGQIYASVAIAMIGFGGVYFIGDLLRNLRSHSQRRAKRAEEIADEVHPPRFVIVSYLLFLAGAALVVVGSRILVFNAVAIATQLNISEAVIGYTIVAFGTSLPEFVTAIASARKKVSDLAVGNIIGANVANMTLVAGSAGMFAGINLTSQDMLVNMPALLVIVGLFSALLLGWGRVTRWLGFVLVAMYVSYIGLLAAGVGAI